MRFRLRAILFGLVVAGLSLIVVHFPSAAEPRPVVKSATSQKPKQPEQTRIYEIRYRPTAAESCTVRHAYEGNTPQGEWIWKDVAGKVLQTARFEHGEVVEWNGQPVQRALEEWCEGNQIPKRLQAALFAPVADLKWDNDWRQFGVVEIFTHSRLHLLEIFGTYQQDLDEGPVMRAFAASTKRRPTESVALFLLRKALLENRTLGARFSLPSLVSISPTEVNWRDPTGVSAVKFAVDSTAAAEWVEAILEEQPGESIDRKYIRSFFAGTSIEIDASEIPPSVLPEVAPPRTNSRFIDQLPMPREFNRPHRRCDLLGLLLLQREWSCEQRGNVLILHPSPVERSDQSNDQR